MDERKAGLTTDDSKALLQDEKPGPIEYGIAHVLGGGNMPGETIPHEGGAGCVYVLKIMK